MLREVLEQLEVADELQHLLEWVQEAAPAAAEGQQGKEASTATPPNHPVPLAAAERLSYAPLAATSLAAALAALSSRQGANEEPTAGGEASSSVRAAVGNSSEWIEEGLESTDLGSRLGLAAEVLEEVRAALSARLALAQ
jgi:hypothetical protein